MIISDIQDFDNKRSRIYIDGEFAFLLYKGELRDYGISIDAVISDEVYFEITNELLPTRATKRAMNLLQKRDYTEKQLRDKLAEGLYPEPSIDAATEYVKSYHYIDDERYMRDYITYHISDRSRNRIVQDLTKKGISKDRILAALEEIYEESSENPEDEQIKKLLFKKRYSKDLEYNDRQKIIAFLLRRGYSLDRIKKCMDDFVN